MRCLALLKLQRSLNMGVLLVWTILGSSLPGKAQQAVAEPSAQAIKLTVHLRLGATTVGKMAAQIGDQTGLAIETEPILLEHRILVQMDGISAETALQTLADLNGWEITHPRPGHYRIRPIPVPSPNQITDIPVAFRMALPMDLRRYLGLEDEKAEIPPGSPPAQYKDAFRLHIQDQENQRQITFRNKQLLDMATTTLTVDLPPALRDGHEHPFTVLSREQKDAMVTLLVLNKLNLLNSDLLHGKLKPFQRDWTTAELTLKDGKMLVIGATTKLNGGTMHEAFGAPIQALNPRPESKP